EDVVASIEIDLPAAIPELNQFDPFLPPIIIDGNGFIASSLNESENYTMIEEKLILDKAFNREWRRAIRYRTLLSLVLIEIDFFTNYLNSKGRENSVECISDVASALNSKLKRPGDELINFGNEQFALVLPDTDGPGAKTVVTRMRSLFEG